MMEKFKTAEAKSIISNFIEFKYLVIKNLFKKLQQ